MDVIMEVGMKRNRVYALITRHCNLTCKYCVIRNCNETFDEKKFIDQLSNFDGTIILFGGEPTLYHDRLFKIYNNPNISHKITSITTNMMSIDNDLIDLFNNMRGVATSWNPDRFNNDEYEIWLDNISRLNGNINKKVMVLVTLVDSVLSLTPDEFNSIISRWNSDVISSIRFEHLVDRSITPEYFEKVDNWLCNIYKSWNSSIRMANKDSILNWHQDCSDIFTLTPEGILRHGCPHNSISHIPTRCYTCNKVDICQPCRLQRYCSFSEKFYNLVKGDTFNETNR